MGEALADGTRKAVTVDVVVAAATGVAVADWVAELVAGCWLSVVCAGVLSVSELATAEASETERLDCAFGFSTVVALGVLAWTRAAEVGLRVLLPAADGVFDDDDAALSWPALAVRADFAVPLLAFAGPADTEEESLSGLSALAMATVGHARDRPNATAAAPARAPRWTFAMEEPPSCHLLPVKSADFRQTPRCGCQTAGAAVYPFAFSANIKLSRRLWGAVTRERRPDCDSPS
ncbi:hypothetical protein MAIC_06270 [Mycolicibacterium aichiense]|uniref:Uncharacterized protein n=1 Tax=Mycolicibacterium aichiense TaxID=1799 RepID=A0AAD1MAY9_9MYCO|nr:hypothetical protein MAIC_06270 [Mycolicibacterium aichiense]